MPKPETPRRDAGFTVFHEALSADEVHPIRCGVEDALRRVLAQTQPIDGTVTAEGRRIQTVCGESFPDTSVHWEYQPSGRPPLDEARPFDARESDEIGPDGGLSERTGSEVRR